MNMLEKKTLTLRTGRYDEFVNSTLDPDALCY